MPITCPQCKSHNPEGAASCAACSAALPAAGFLEPAASAKPAPRTPAGRAPGRAGLWGYRLAVVVLLLALAAAQVKLGSTRADLRDAREDLDHARVTLELAITGDQLPDLRLVPPDGQPIRVGKKLAQCLVEEVTFAGSQVTVRISNPTGAPTQPFVRVVLFDDYGHEVSDGAIVAYRSRSLASAEAKTLTERVQTPTPRPRYFRVTDQP